MFFLMLKESFLRRNKRKGLAIATIALSSALISTLLTISVDVGNKMARELKSYGANISIVPKGENFSLEIGNTNYNPLKGLVFLEETDLPKIKEIFWRNNIIGFAPFLKTIVEVDDGQKKYNTIQMVGTYFDKHLPLPDEKDFHTGARIVYPYWQIKGNFPNDEKNPFLSLIVGKNLARAMNWKVGKQIKITPLIEKNKTVNFVIKGILHTGGDEENWLVASLADVQNLTNLQGKVHSVSVSALTLPENTLSRKARHDTDSLTSLEYDHWYCTAYVSSIAYQIEEAIPNAFARPIWQVAEGEGTIIKKIQLLMFVVTIISFIASALGISSLMTASILERSKEIGLMKAIGADEKEVYLLFLSEAAINGIIGGVFGTITGTGISQIIGLSIFGDIVSFNPIIIPVVIIISVLIAVAGSLMPSKLITGLQLAEVLHGAK